MSRRYPSNSPTPSSVSGRNLPDDAVVDKGFVSTRIDTYGKSIAKSGEPHPSYPPSFPRARFERVQTHGDWPSYNADLYNQPHPRTLSLAPTSTFDVGDRSQHEQQEYNMHDKHQVKGDPSSSLRVAGLKYLWESKGQSQNAANASQQTSAASSLTTPSIGDWSSPHVENNRTRADESALELAAINSLQSQPVNVENGELSGSSQNLQGYSKVRHHQDGQSLEAGPPKASGSPQPKSRRKRDAKIPTEKTQSLQARHLPSRGSSGITPSSNRTSKTQKTPIEPLTLFSTDADSCHPSNRFTSSSHSTPQPPTPRRSVSMKQRHHHERRIPKEFDHTTHARISSDHSMDSTSTSSSEYHSMDHAEPMFQTRRENTLTSTADKGSTIAETARTLEHNDDRNPSAPRLSCTRDVAVQTDSFHERDLGESSSVWSGSQSVVERQEQQLSHHHGSKPVRLERRLGRRPGIRTVQVIVSLDGADDLVVDARLKRKRRDLKSRSS